MKNNINTNINTNKLDMFYIVILILSLIMLSVSVLMFALYPRVDEIEKEILKTLEVERSKNATELLSDAVFSLINCNSVKIDLHTNDKTNSYYEKRKHDSTGKIKNIEFCTVNEVDNITGWFYVDFNDQLTASLYTTKGNLYNSFELNDMEDEALDKITDKFDNVLNYIGFDALGLQDFCKLDYENGIKQLFLPKLAFIQNSPGDWDVENLNNVLTLTKTITYSANITNKYSFTIENNNFTEFLITCCENNNDFTTIKFTFSFNDFEIPEKTETFNYEANIENIELF